MDIEFVRDLDGHNGPVLCVLAVHEFSVILSGGEDGLLLVFLYFLLFKELVLFGISIGYPLFVR